MIQNDETPALEGSGDVAGGLERFRFNRPRFFTPLLVVVLATAPVGMIVPWLRDVWSDAPWQPGLIFITATTLVVWAIACGVRALLRPKSPPTIELHPDGAVLPLSSGSKRWRGIAYQEITSLNVFGKGRWARMLVATKHRNFIYPMTHFEGGASTLAAFRAALRARIAASPGGVAILRGIDERDARGSLVAQRPQRATVSLLALTGAAFTWTWYSGALEGPFDLVPYGANAPALVADGEWYRLLAANFLHAGWLHVYFNMFGILVLGMLLERLVGRWRFLCIFLVSAAVGALASTLVARAALSVGASTAVFGLLGAHAFINLRYRASLPGGFSQPLRAWIIVLGINAVLPFVVPVIDWAAHVGGFIAGALAAAALCPARDAELLGRPAGARLKAATVALAAVFVAALGQAAASGLKGGEAEKLRVAEAFIEQQSRRPAALNTIAWQYATKPDVTEAELALAERAATLAVGLDSTNAAFIDTLATVYYRGRRFDAAVTEQLRTLRLDDRPVLVSQMGRFLDARFAELGPFTVGHAAPETIEARIEWPHLILDLAEDVEHGLEIYALDNHDGRLTGIAQLQLGPGVPAGTRRMSFNERAPPLQASRLSIAYVDASGCACPEGGSRFRYLPIHREVRRLPGPLEE